MGAIATQITSLTIVYSTVYSDADQRRHQSSVSLAFVWIIHRGPGLFPAQMASYVENVSIWWRHHGYVCHHRIAIIIFCLGFSSLERSYICHTVIPIFKQTCFSNIAKIPSRVKSVWCIIFSFPIVVDDPKNRVLLSYERQRGRQNKDCDLPWHLAKCKNWGTHTKINPSETAPHCNIVPAILNDVW